MIKRVVMYWNYQHVNCVSFLFVWFLPVVSMFSQIVCVFAHLCLPSLTPYYNSW